MREGRPASGFVARLDPANYRNRTLRDLCKTAGIEKVGPHMLRDTYASQLLSAGITLAYVSAQLGHADVAITARSYAKWVGDEPTGRPSRSARARSRPISSADSPSPTRVPPAPLPLKTRSPGNLGVPRA